MTVFCDTVYIFHSVFLSYDVNHLVDTTRIPFSVQDVNHMVSVFEAARKREEEREGCERRSLFVLWRREGAKPGCKLGKNTVDLFGLSV